MCVYVLPSLTRRGTIHCKMSSIKRVVFTQLFDVAIVKCLYSIRLAPKYEMSHIHIKPYFNSEFTSIILLVLYALTINL